jgi:D-beta-D-heptose 7-phosphate kinase/D-beta-D-heptose 1-phosphate adenosyltransferase
MTLLEGDKLHHFPAEAAEVQDVSGAGDTVVATIAAGLGAKLPLPVAVRLANIAAGIAVGKVGTAVTREEEILEALGPERGALRKVMSRSAALEQVERWRRRGWRVGFTNGCFDLLHPGHVHLLEQSRSWCDRLVVGLNSDDSVKRLKGPARPIQNEAARAAVLASLATVDCVTVFDEETPLELIRLFQPEVLVKGADYTVETVVGAEIVQGYGGQVKLAELLPGNSTTATVARMKG